LKRPHIYGDEARCRKAVARHIDSGQELLDQAVGVRKRLDALPDDRISLRALYIQVRGRKRFGDGSPALKER
jgi:hypothetical protein